MSDLLNTKSDIFSKSSLFKPQLFPQKSSLFGTSFKPTLERQIAEQENLARRYKIPIPGEKDKLRVWDLLEWARYPITNMLYTAAKEHMEDDLGFEDVGKILKSAMYGTMLKERRNTDDVLRMLYPNMKEWQYAVFGIAGDILTDPLTWVTFGGCLLYTSPSPRD